MKKKRIQQGIDEVCHFQTVIATCKHLYHNLHKNGVEIFMGRGVCACQI